MWEGAEGSEGREDREIRRKNCSGNFSVPEYFRKEMLPKGKPEPLKKIC
ncbi:hypothetical protein [Okeania sp. SIO2C2]|nr:hypothetical protein [Okeania sp. SIO2C2]